jgi:serine phosphatase RsbU (regulator of sigma subunit)
MDKQKNSIRKRIQDFFVRIFRAQPEVKSQETEKSPPDSFDLSGMLEKKISPLNDPIWRLLLLLLGGSFLTWFFSLLFGLKSSLSVWFISLVALATVLTAGRMLLLVTKLKKFWKVLLAIGFVFLLLTVFVPEFVHVAGSIAFVFLLFRKYKPYRHLTSRRRAALFMMGLIVFLLMTAGFSNNPSNVATETTEVIRTLNTLSLETSPRFEDNLALFGIWTLRLFWFFTLFNLFFGIRLHFMKIRPKLAISSFLITVVPVLLILLMSIFIIYSTIGLNRAIRGQSILLDWAEFGAQNPDFIPALASSSFVYGRDAEEVNTRGDSPRWVPEFLQAAGTENSSATKSLTTERATYLWIDQELWLVHFEGDIARNYKVTAGLVDESVMDRLASILHSDVKLSLTNPISFPALGKEKVVGFKTDDAEPQKKEIEGTYLSPGKSQTLPETGDISIWQQRLYSGMTHLDVTALSEGKFQDFSLLLLTEGSVASLFRDMFSARNPLSLVVVAGLITLAFVLILLEAFALYFGMRITGGITSAVRALHRGTRRIAQGDLKTQIQIPNEDELGDLASSFNEMTGAIITGQKEALAREHLERELKTAREIQERLLPHEMPRMLGFEISGINLPSLQVGGDYFDFLELESGYLGIAIADVCGKGIPAALLMANLQASLHGLAIEPGEVATVITRMNDLLVRSTDPHMFATFIYGVLDRRLSSFISTNAGHNPPFHFRSDRQHNRLGPNGLIIGFLPHQKYTQITTKIEPGDVLVLYTDGITEAIRNTTDRTEEKYFGEERLVEVVKQNLQKSARDIQSAILKAISDFSAGSPQNDDITLVVIKRNRPPDNPGER